MKHLVYLFLISIAISACGERIAPQWEQVSTPVSHKFQTMIHPSDSVWWLAGGIRFGEESLLKSTDQGETWQLEAEFFGQTWFDGSFLSPQEGYFCGISGKALRTLDGGQTWLLSQIPNWLPMRGIAATEKVVLSVGGVAYDIGVIARSVDKGLSWKIIDTPEIELRDVLFVDEETAYACGFGTILRSKNAGISWELLPVEGEFFTSMAFPTAALGFAVGRTGTIMRTRNGGDQWESLRNGDAFGKKPHFYNHVTFWDEEVGYIVGDKGLVLQTTDGGETWLELRLEKQEDLYDIVLTGPQQGFVMGDQGCLFRFSF